MTTMRGQVYDQSPRGGLTVATDTEITIYVSSGSETFQLEDYSGDTAEQVQTALTALNLIPNLTYEYSDDVQEGRVISTDPEPGTEVSEGDRITVVISSGAEQVTVPYVIDQTEAAATQRLRDAGFSVTTQSFESNKTAGTVADVVYNGSSVSGGTAPSGATLTLLISTGPAQTQETQAQTVTQSEDLGLDFGDDEDHTVSVSINGGSERSLGTYNSDTVGNCRVTISGRPGSTITVEVFVDGESIGERTFTINEG